MPRYTHETPAADMQSVWSGAHAAPPAAPHMLLSETDDLC